MSDSDSARDPRVIAVLEALDAAFRPLLKQLSYDLEPAVILSESAVAGE